MATISIPKQIAPLSIEKFLGLNTSKGSDTQLELGEASKMKNCRIVDGYKLETICGYKNILSARYKDDIKAMWYGKVANKNIALLQHGQVLFKVTFDGSKMIMEELSEIQGTANFKAFENKVYILNGYEYYVFDGDTLKVVDGYVPLIAISTPNEGGGTDFESINLLNGKRHQTFSPNGSAKTFKLREDNIKSVDKVLINGNKITAYSINLATGIVTMNSVPTKGVDTVDIYWTVDNGDNRKHITRNKYMTAFGSGNDTRIFIYGDEEYKNRFRYGELANGLMTGEYFPANNFKDEAEKNYAITGMVKHYDRLIVFKENCTRYTYYKTIEVDNTEIIALESYPLNDTTGNIAINQIQTLENNPVCFNKKGMYMFVQTNVKDERNVKYMSERIQSELDELDMSKAITLDYEDKKELWIAIGNKVYIYNYELNVFSKLVLAHKPNFLILIDKSVMFGADNGKLMMFDDMYTDFDGETIEQCWVMNYYNFGTDTRRKNVNRLFVTLIPYYVTNVNITFETDRGTSTQTFNCQNYMNNFVALDFGNFSFDSSYNPRPRRLKLKAKKFVYFKLKLENKVKGKGFKIDTLSLKYTVGGETK